MVSSSRVAPFSGINQLSAVNFLVERHLQQAVDRCLLIGNIFENGLQRQTCDFPISFTGPLQSGSESTFFTPFIRCNFFAQVSVTPQIGWLVKAAVLHAYYHHIAVFAKLLFEFIQKHLVGIIAGTTLAKSYERRGRVF